MALLVGGVLLFALLGGPVLNAFLVPDAFSIEPVNSLPRAQLYYSAVSSFVGVIVGMMGLAAGFYYYDKNHRRAAYDAFVAKIEKVDLLVRRILEKLIEDQRELKEVRLSLTILFEDIVAILDEEGCFIAQEEDRKKIVGLYRFVDKCDAISVLSLENVRTFDVSNVYGNYTHAIKIAKGVCRKCRP